MPATRRNVLATGLVGVSGLLMTACTGPADAAVPDVPAGPRFDVRKYGAKVDGRTNDTAAVGRASRAAAAARGVVWFPAGITVLDDFRATSAHVAYAGGGRKSVIRITAAGDRGLKVLASHVSFTGLRFVRAARSSPFLRIQAPRCLVQQCSFVDTASSAREGVVVDPEGAHAVVRDCRFRSLRAASILVDGAASTRLLRNTITDQRYEYGYSSCIQLVGKPVSPVIVGNSISVSPSEPTALNGISLAGSDVRVIGNTIVCSRFSIEGRKGVSGRIAENRCSISIAKVKGRWNYAAGISLPYSRRVSVIGNHVDQLAAYKNSYVAIELPNSAHCVVRSNVLLGTKHAPVGVILDSSSSCVVERNQVLGYRNGILVYGHGASASQNVVAGNTVQFVGAAPTSYGVSIQLDTTGSADGNLLQDNDITGLGQGTAILLDVGSGSGTLSGTRIRRNPAYRTDRLLHRYGDTSTRFS